MTEIRAHTERGDLGAIARLSPKLKELSLMEEQLTDLEQRISSFSGQGVTGGATTPLSNEAMPPSYSFTRSRAPQKQEQTRLKVTVRWSALGKALSDEILMDRFANITQAELLGKLVLHLGQTVLHQLKEFSKTQGGRMHISENPKRDPNFINQANDTVYAHKPIPGTNLFLLTNTSTEEKKEDLDLFLNFARLPREAVSVEIIGK